MSDLSGDWQVELKFISGQARHKMHLVQDGQGLSGRYDSTYGEHEVRGRVQDGVVEIQVEILYQGVGTTYSFQGRLEGDVVQGKVGLGEYWEAVWKARR